MGRCSGRRARRLVLLLSEACRAGAWSTLIAVALFLSGSPRAEAQMALEQYRPAPLSTDGFGVARPESLGHLNFAAQLQLSYGRNALAFHGRPKPVLALEHQFVGHAMVALGVFDELTFFVGLPVQILQQNPAGERGAGVGDAWLGARFSVLGGRLEHFNLAADFTARLPSAEWSDRDQGYAGDELGSYDMSLVAEVAAGRFAWGLRPGVRLRKAQYVGDDLVLRHELMLATYMRLRLTDRLFAHAELYGSSAFNAFFERGTTPLEALFGVKGQAGPWLLGVAAGPGILDAWSSVDYRIVGTVGLVQPLSKDPDPDRDGFLTPHDTCPNEPEDLDGFADEDGCPDPDNDGDGILDGVDQCPEEPEDLDGFADEDGCLDSDDDGDELLDSVDQCPHETEDRDGFQDEDGCPDLDNDGDGILDPDDKCPNEIGTEEHGGCAPPPPPPEPEEPAIAVLDKGEIRITQRIEFAVNKDKLLPESVPVLEAVYKILEENPDVKLLRVEGHTDSRGREARNMELSRKRAASVANWLINRGLPAERLSAAGCGPQRPIEPNITAEGRKKNRRVEFHLVEPAPAEPVDASMCKPMQLK